MTDSEFSDSQPSSVEINFSESPGQYHSSILYSFTKPFRNRLRKLTSSRDVGEIDSTAVSSNRSSRRSSNDITLPHCPPPEYTSQVSLCSSEAVSENEEEHCSRNASLQKRHDPALVDTGISDAQSSSTIKSKNGIRWKYGHQGSCLNS